jgi:hypothetical protein
LVLGVVIANQFLGYFALTGEPANSTLGLCSSLPLEVKQNIHVLELFGLLRSNLMRFDPREASIGIRAFRPLGMKPCLAPRQTNMAGYPIPWKMEDCQTVRRSLIYEGFRISTLFLHERLDSLLSRSGRRSVPLIKIKLHLPSELIPDLGD